MAKFVNERADVLPVLVEVFREHGYDGTSLSVIGERTGLGKGSLYNFFPGGKDGRHALRLAFSFVSPEEIAEGVSVLGGLVRAAAPAAL